MKYFFVGIFGLSIVLRQAWAQDTTETSNSRQGWVGVSLIQGDSAAPNYPIIASVEPDAPAQQAGLEAGDTILSYGHLDARNTPHGIWLLQPGRRVVFRIRRNGLRNIPVIVRHLPSQTTSMTVDLGNSNFVATMSNVAAMLSNINITSIALGQLACNDHLVMTGMDVAPLTADLADALNVRNTGMLVLNVTPDSPAMKGGLKSGDVIVMVYPKTPVNTSADLRKAILARKGYEGSPQSVILNVLRKGKPRKVTLRL